MYIQNANNSLYRICFRTNKTWNREIPVAEMGDRVRAKLAEKWGLLLFISVGELGLI